jgi:hypothetical protein
LRAADAFNLLGWQIEEAIASEAGGQLARAAAIYQRLGATRALRRIRTEACSLRNGRARPSSRAANVRSSNSPHAVTQTNRSPPRLR